MARQIGQMLNSREPKIVNGPQILDKYVGESEANIRRLFEEAEEEEKRLGPNSGDICSPRHCLIVTLLLLYGCQRSCLALS